MTIEEESLISKATANVTNFEEMYDAIRDVLQNHEQTPELCKEGVELMGNCLEFVEEQSPELCVEAVLQNSNNADFIRDNYLKEVVVSVVEKHERDKKSIIRDDVLTYVNRNHNSLPSMPIGESYSVNTFEPSN